MSFSGTKGIPQCISVSLPWESVLFADKRNTRILKQLVLGKQAALGSISCMESRGQAMLCLPWL